MSRVPITVLLLACLAVPLAVRAAQVTEVIQAGRAFSLKQVTLHRGDSIRFVNADHFLHQVSVEGPGMDVVSDEQEPGTTNTLQFNDAGLFQVMCQIHPKMHLAVTVQ